ncbi:histone H2A [Schistosoma bovis]|uniref:Histone H2A n=1 Tax=Schistosoma bovis TaxID=6184 RepID=A0A430QUX5_SCHBO|nr:histone H2A [Schistosoma bovis]
MNAGGKGGKSRAKVKTRSAPAGLQFPVGRVHCLLRKAVLEYITAEVFELVGNAARDSVVEDYINKKFILDRQAFFRLTNVNKSNNEQQM